MSGASFLRFVAIILIANSHLDALYPVPELATGGSIGNALFFMLSGYGLYLSAQNKDRSLLQWYKRRIIRIYPSVIIASILLIVIAQSAWQNLDFLGYVKLFVWPTNYWFISALMIFYVIFFLLLKTRNYRYFLAGILIMIIPYLYFYLTVVDLSKYSIEGPGYFKWIFYLQAMLFGAYLAGRKFEAKSCLIRYFLMLILAVVIYYGILIFMSRFGGWQYQAITHVLMFPILFLFIKVSETDLVSSVMRIKYFGAFVSLMSLMTLEIYLLHGYVRVFPIVQKSLFPLNIMVFWLVTIFLSYILYKVVKLIRAKLEAPLGQ